jgi:hypothetical protein
MFAVKLGRMEWQAFLKQCIRQCLTNMQNELDVIRDITIRFSGAGLEYMLTGSVAMNYYVLPRMTRDIDALLLSNRRMLTELWRCSRMITH